MQESWTFNFVNSELFFVAVAQRRRQAGKITSVALMLVKSIGRLPRI